MGNTTTRTVARNSLWYGLELGFNTVATIIISVLVARHFGPERLGMYNFVLWLTYVAGALGSVGIPATAGKYIAEYWARGDRPMAHRIFRSALTVQMAVATVVIAIVWVAVWWSVPRDFLGVATWMVIAVWPRQVGFIPSQANMAQENIAANVPGSLLGTITQAAMIAGTLLFDWDLTGMALSHVLGHGVEMSVKLYPLVRQAWASAAPPLDPELRSRMLRFSTQGIGLMALSVLVFDRFDLVLLRMLNGDVKQLTFFSLSFTLADKLMLLPQSLGGAMGASLMAQYGRDKSRVTPMAATSTIYLLVTGLPVLLGAVAISGPVWSIYGDRYEPAVPVFMVIATCAIARLFLMPAQTVLQVTENQGFLVWWGVVCGVVNVAVDVALIPGWGATGAALGNGAGRVLMAAGAWVRIWQLFRPAGHSGVVLKLFASAAIMAMAAMVCARQLPAAAGAGVGVAAGALVYLAMLRWTGALGGTDRDRLLSLTRALPRRLRSPFERVLLTVVPGTR